MKSPLLGILGATVWATLLLATLIAADASAQSASLLSNPARQRSLTLTDYSWTYQPSTDPKPMQVNDLVTVLVDYKTQVLSEGEMDRKKKANGDLTLRDWVLLKGLWAVPDPQTLGDPKIGGSANNKYKAEATLESRDAMKFSIACRVTDIRPNGNLILEAHRTIKNNLDQWDISLTGEVRADDVSVANTVDSEVIADLKIHKRESGHVRDGYRRGWFLQWLDLIQLF